MKQGMISLMKATTRTLVILSILLLLTGIGCKWALSETCCWLQFGSDEAHSSYAAATLNPPLSIVWKKSTEHVAISGSPVANENRMVLLLYLGTSTSDYSLQGFTLDGSGLHFQWHVALSGIQLGTSPALAGNAVICPVGSSLDCFSLETGNKVWEVMVPSQPLTPVILENGSMAAVTSLSGELHLVDLAQGRILWTRGDLEGSQCYFFDIPTAGDGMIFVCYSTGDEEGVAAFDIHGELVWKREAKIQSTCVNECVFTILYSGGILYAIENSGVLCALNGETGNTLWTYRGRVLRGDMSSDGETLYAYSKTDEGIICLDAETGAETWESPNLFPGEKGIPVYVYKSIVSTRDYVFICRYTVHDIGNTQITALDKQTGEKVWESEELEGLNGPLIVCDNVLIVKTSSSLIGFGSQPEPLESTSVETASPKTIPSSLEPGGPPLVLEWYYFIVVAGIIAVLAVYILLERE
jgi:outer membrane protein assembly factor BamB